MEQIVKALRADYERGRDIDRPGRVLEKQTVAELTGQLLELIYPTKKSLCQLSMLVEEVLFTLTEQLNLIFVQTMRPGAAQAEAEETGCRFLETVVPVREVVQTDVEAFFEGDPAAESIDEIISCYPGLFAVTVYRLAHELHRLGVPLLPRMMTEYAHSLTGIDIHPGAQIGKWFFIDHGTGIVIGETTVIGDHVKLYQGVTLGALTTRGGQSLRGKKRHPTVEDNVTIYAGATILGGNTVIGRDSVIGANVFITSSVPEKTMKSLPQGEGF